MADKFPKTRAALAEYQRIMEHRPSAPKDNRAPWPIEIWEWCRQRGAAQYRVEEAYFSETDALYSDENAQRSTFIKYEARSKSPTDGAVNLAKGAKP